jgi:hypothetical protein
MKRFFLILTFLNLLSMDLPSQSPKQLSALWDKTHITRIFPSDVRHRDLQNYLESLKQLGLKVEEVGRSNANREINQIEFGRGPLRVFMWSQMHGDEPTATSALVDMFAFLQKNRTLEWVRQIEENLTIRAVPMLNPDGAELYQRRNLQNIDINRDARNLVTPEARLLKKLRDDWSPHVGFNLHNQNELTTVGQTSKQAAISLLVVYGDEAKTTNEGHERNRRVTAAIAQALNVFIPGHIGRYDDEYTPTAFGDSFSGWGTPVILIETGALHGKDEMFLVKMNFVAFLTALHSLASGSEKSISTAAYDALPPNSSARIINAIFRDASVIDPVSRAASPVGDIAVIAQRRRAGFLPSFIIRSVGVRDGLAGLDEYDASNFIVLQKFRKLQTGQPAELLFFKKQRRIDWNSADLEKEFPPDAIFSLGRWLKGGDLLPKK